MVMIIRGVCERKEERLMYFVLKELVLCVIVAEAIQQLVEQQKKAQVLILSSETFFLENWKYFR
jgi:hypothetical protein